MQGGNDATVYPAYQRPGKPGTVVPGVEKAYAIQAGRELRVIVEADKVSDGDSDKLSFEIAQKIQEEMTFPGQIKVTVIREKKEPLILPDKLIIR